MPLSLKSSLSQAYPCSHTILALEMPQLCSRQPNGRPHSKSHLIQLLDSAFELKQPTLPAPTLSVLTDSHCV